MKESGLDQRGKPRQARAVSDGLVYVYSEIKGTEYLSTTAFAIVLISLDPVPLHMPD